jgi:hypothetical protein
VGDDSILLTHEDIIEATRQAGGTIFVGPIKRPDLAVNKGTLSRFEKERALNTIDRIDQDLQQGLMRRWSCDKCCINAYPKFFETESGSRPIRGWAESVKKLILIKARSAYPEYLPRISMIGIEPPPSAKRGWPEAEAFVKELEEHASFEAICFRVFVGFHNANTDEFAFAKHIEVMGGKTGEFFWPPRKDWESTPIIYDFGNHVSQVTTP